MSSEKNWQCKFATRKTILLDPKHPGDEIQDFNGRLYNDKIKIENLYFLVAVDKCVDGPVPNYVREKITELWLISKENFAFLSGYPRKKRHTVKMLYLPRVRFFAKMDTLKFLHHGKVAYLQRNG